MMSRDKLKHQVRGQFLSRDITFMSHRWLRYMMTAKHQAIEMKLCMTHYINKSIPLAKFEADSYSGFGDMTSQNFPQKKGTSHQIRL